MTFKEFEFEYDDKHCKLVIESETDVDPDLIEELYENHETCDFVNLSIEVLSDDEWEYDDDLTYEILNTTLIDHSTEDLSKLEFVFKKYRYLFKNLK